jgi:signal transduction histidine kinase
VGIKAKQVAGVTTLVVVVVVAMSAYHVANLVTLNFSETASRGQMLAQAVFQRAREVVAQGVTDPYEALRTDGGIRSIIESSTANWPSVTYVAIVNKDGVAVVHSNASLEGLPLEKQEDFGRFASGNSWKQLNAAYDDRILEFSQPMEISEPTPDDQVKNFGEIRVGVTTTLVRTEIKKALGTTAWAIVVALVVASVVAMLLSQWMLRPIHVIQSGLTRLGRGELNVKLDLEEQEFRDLGSSFDAISAQLSALGGGAKGDQAGGELRAGSATDLESVMDNLEDAVALFSPRGELIFANKSMDAFPLRTLNALPAENPVRQIIERTLAGRKSQGPVSISGFDPSDTTERLLVTHVIEDTGGRFLGAMLVARNIGYLSQVQSTLNYSRKLAALGRLMAGVAHEVKNPLNAMTIHLELLKQKLARQPAIAGAGPNPGARAVDSGFGSPPDVTKHVDIIAKEIRRLDEVLNGFLKFARPDELKLQPVRLSSLISDIQTSVAPEATRRHVTMKVECPESLPEINADPGMLSQALLNLALNACQAMPDGGTLKISCRTAPRRRVEIDIEDTGIGIPPENLGRIFDLYFTTKEKGSGIGLSMVYRIVQLHDGEVEVQSTPGRGTRFRLTFPQA